MVISHSYVELPEDTWTCWGGRLGEHDLLFILLISRPSAASDTLPSPKCCASDVSCFNNAKALPRRFISSLIDADWHHTVLIKIGFIPWFIDLFIHLFVHWFIFQLVDSLIHSWYWDSVTEIFTEGGHRCGLHRREWSAHCGRWRCIDDLFGFPVFPAPGVDFLWYQQKAWRESHSSKPRCSTRCFDALRWITRGCWFNWNFNPKVSEMIKCLSIVSRFFSSRSFTDLSFPRVTAYQYRDYSTLW